MQGDQIPDISDVESAAQSTNDDESSTDGDGSASSNHENSFSEPEVDVQEPQQTAVEAEAPLPRSPPVSERRSTRTRREPGWLRSGDYVTKAAVPVKQQWQQKADYIADCISRGLFTGLEKQAGEAILTVITNCTT